MPSPALVEAVGDAHGRLTSARIHLGAYVSEPDPHDPLEQIEGMREVLNLIAEAERRLDRIVPPPRTARAA